MDEKKIITALKKVLENENLDITKLLTFEERMELQTRNYKYLKEDEYNKIKYKLFTKEEAEKYDELNLPSKTKRKIELDVKLSDKRKMEILNDEEKNYFYKYEELLKTIENEEYKKEAFEKMLNTNSRILVMDYTQIILSFNDVEQALNIVDKYLQQNIERKTILLNTKIKIKELLKNLTREQYIKVLKLLDKYECIQEYKLLNELDNKIEIFEEIIKLPNYKNTHTNLYQLIDSLNENDSFKAFDLLIENEYKKLRNIEIVELIKITGKDRKKEFINILYDEIEIKDLEIILSNYINQLKNENQRNEFKEYIINDERFNSIKIATYMTKETMLNCIDEALIKANEELTDKEKESLTKKLIEYFENLNYDFEIKKEKVNCKEIIKLISKYENLNEKNLETIINKFGYQILKYLKNENIREAINSTEQELEKIIYIFNDENITIDAHKKDSIIESVIQREFMFQQSKIYNIFSMFETLINKQNPELKNIFDEVIKVVFEKRPKRIQEICKNNNTTIEELYKKIKQGKNIEVLHQITQQYIEIEREEYSKNRTPEFIKQLNLEKKFKKEWILKKYVQVMDSFSIKYKIKNITENLTEEQENLKNDIQQLESIIEFKKNPTKEKMDKINKKNLKTFNELLNILYEKDELNDIPKEETENAEYIYAFKNIEENYLIELLSQLDIKCIKEKLLNQKEKYETLLEILKKHKYLGLGTTFQPVTENIDLNIGTQATAGLINCFYKLYDEYECEKEKQKNFIENHTMTKLLEEGFCHELVSNKYAIIIGDEDFKLIFSNTGRNRSSSPAQSRLNNVLEIIPKMYDKNYLSVPPLNEVITLQNGKQIKVEIGQALDFTNLSVGERTDACLRAKGAFKDLWEFILTNENGFNIIFKTPNDKFISRVSAVRNGNTIFENELRNSVLKEYTSEDLVEANQIVTQMLERSTKNCESPIENIIITNDYAMAKETDKKQKITTNRIDAMYGLNFNYDKNDTFEGIILSNNGKLKEIKLGIIEKVYPIEKNTKAYYKEDAIKKIRQINAINQLLNGIPIENIEIRNIEYNQEDLTCISNNEYYILKSKDEIIETFILDKCKQKNSYEQKNTGRSK